MNEEKSTRQLSALIDRLLAQPQLLEAVASLLRDVNQPSEDVTDSRQEEVEATASAANGQEEAVQQEASPLSQEDDKTQQTAAHVPTQGIGMGERRHRLLSAIKPYLSAPRAKALDSIEAIAELMDVLKHA